MRRIKKANIQFISLVPAGANKLQPVYKTDGSVTFGTLVKASESFDDQGELTAVVYAPEHRDSQGDIASADVVKQMAYDFIANGGSIDIKHNGKAVTKEQARIAETFLVQKTDSRFHGWKDADGNPVDLTGAWATVIKIDDPQLRKLYKNGDWAGVSMGGTAVVEQEKSAGDALAELLAKALNSPSNPKQETMDATQITKAINDGFAELLKAIKPVEQKQEQKQEQKADDTPVFKGKADDDRALELHARQVQLHQLKKAVDWNKPESIREYRETVSALKAEWAAADAEAGIEETQQDDKPVRKAGAAVAPKAGGEKHISAKELADSINKSRGFAVKEN